MAKKDEQKAKSNGVGKSRMRVFVAGFDMEGSDEVMAEGFKAIRELSASISHSTILPPALAGKPALGAPKLEDAPGAAPSTAVETEIEEPVEGTTIEGEDVDVDDDAEEETSNGNGGPKRTYTHKAPEFLHALDLSKAAKPLADFMAEKGNPTEIYDRYMVIAVWLKEQMAVNEFSIAHVWTAYNFLGWKSQMPENHSQPLRDLKSKKNFLTKEKGEGYKVSWPGEQYVAKMGA